jgi:membrane protease YdiL (CAAX protease family)
MAVAEENHSADGRPAGNWHPVLAFLAVLLIVLVGAVVGVIATTVLLPVGSNVPMIDPKAPVATLTGLLATQLVMIVGALMLGRMRGARPWRSLALAPAANGARDYLIGTLATIVVLGIYNIVVIYGLRHDFWADLRPFASLVRHDAWLLAFLAIAVGAPLSEELLFRGFLQSALTPGRLGFMGAAVISTLFWAGLHWGYSIVGMIEVVIIGLLFAWMVRRSGSIRPGLLIHAVYNGALTLLLRFGPVLV